MLQGYKTKRHNLAKQKLLLADVIMFWYTISDGAREGEWSTKMVKYTFYASIHAWNQAIFRWLSRLDKQIIPLRV